MYRAKTCNLSPVTCNLKKMNYTYPYKSPLGSMTLASDGDALTGLWFDDQKHYAYTLPPEHEETPLPVFCLTAKWLDIYFGGKEPDFTPPLRLSTTPFSRLKGPVIMSSSFHSLSTPATLANRRIPSISMWKAPM